MLPFQLTPEHTMTRRRHRAMTPLRLVCTIFRPADTAELLLWLCRLRFALRMRAFLNRQLPRRSGDRLARGHCYFEHAIIKLRRGVIRIHTFGQGQAAIEIAVVALRAIVAFAVFLMFAAAFALDRETFIRKFDFDVVFLQAWQVSAHDEFAIAFEDLDFRSPCAAGFAR